MLFKYTGATWLFKYDVGLSTYTELGGKLVGTGYAGPPEQGNIK